MGAFGKDRGERKSHPILIAVIFLGLALLFIITGVKDLFMGRSVSLDEFLSSGAEKGDRVEGVVHYCAGEYYEIKHSLNYLIPTGYEHYYIVYSDDLSTAVTVRSWGKFKDKFTGLNNEEGVKIKGVVRELDREVKNELDGQLPPDGLTQKVERYYYIDDLSPFYGVLKLFEGIYTLAVMAAIVVLVKRNGAVSGPVTGKAAAIGVLLIVTSYTVIMIHLLSLM